MATLTVAERKANPTAVYKEPAELISASISTAAKLEILKNWEDEAVQLQKAADESMIGGEPSRLAEVRRVIDILNEKAQA